MGVVQSRKLKKAISIIVWSRSITFACVKRSGFIFNILQAKAKGRFLHLIMQTELSPLLANGLQQWENVSFIRKCVVRHELNILVSIHLRILHFLAFFILHSLYSHFPPCHLDLLFLLYFLSCNRHEISVLNLFLSLNLFLFTVGITHEMVNAVPSPKFNANITICLLRE